MNKILSKEVKIALAVIVSAVIIVVGIDYLKGVNIMKPANYYYMAFDNVKGLNLSAPVEIDGYKVGLVRNMNYDYLQGKIIVEIDVDKSVSLTRGSYAGLEAGVLATSIISIHPDRMSSEFYAPGDTIPGVNSNDMMSTISNEILPKISAMIPKIDSILYGINKIVNSPELSTSIKNIEQITANLTTSTKELSKFTAVKLPSISNNIDSASANIKEFTCRLNDIKINEIAENADTTVANIKKITKQMNSNTNTIGLLLNERDVYDNMVKTLSNFDSLIIDLKKNPGRYVQFSVFGKKNK